MESLSKTVAISGAKIATGLISNTMDTETDKQMKKSKKTLKTESDRLSLDVCICPNIFSC